MKILIAILILLAGYYFLFHGSALEKDLYFNGEAYSHVKKVRGGEMTNHFYTLEGMDVRSALKFIQIIEFSEKIQKANWPIYLKPLFNRYKLTSVEGQPFELAGTSKQANISFNSYAAPIDIKGVEHMAFFIRAIDNEHDNESKSDKIATIEELKSIGYSFN